MIAVSNNCLTILVLVLRVFYSLTGIFLSGSIFPLIIFLTYHHRRLVPALLETEHDAQMSTLLKSLPW